MSKNTQKKIILFNGPKNCGKSMVIDGIHSAHIFSSTVINLKDPLEAGAKAILGLKKRYMKEVQGGLKDCNVVLPGVPNKTRYNHRKFLIDMSENFLKKHFSPEILADLYCKNVMQAEETMILTSFGGFSGEAATIADCFGIDNILVIRISRPFHEYDYTDSRSYYEGEKFGVTCLDLNNDSTKDDILNRVDAGIGAWLRTQKS